MTHTLIIAEAGVNHNGSLALAKQLIDKAVEVDLLSIELLVASGEVSDRRGAAELDEDL